MAAADSWGPSLRSMLHTGSRESRARSCSFVLRRVPAETKLQKRKNPGKIMLGEEMGYELEFVRVGGEQSFGQIKASVVYTFSISNGHDKTKADVVITCGGVEFIEKGG